MSVKDDLVADTIGWRSQLGGHVLGVRPDQRVVDRSPTPTCRCSTATTCATRNLRPRIVRASWSPLSNATTWQGALTTAFDLTRAGASADGGADGDNKFFYESAESLLACYLYAAANSSGSMRTVLRWIAQHVHEHVEDILDQLPSIEAARVLPRDLRRRPQDPRQHLLHRPTHRRRRTSTRTSSAAAETDRLHPGRVLRRSTRTRCTSLRRRRTRNGSGSCSTWSSSSSSTPPTRGCSPNGRSLDRKVLAILDELPNIAPINNLGGIASTVASQGMQLVSVVQDLSQLHTRYGSNDANTIINNHRALLLLTGVKDTVTLDLASKLLGNIEQTQTSISRDVNGWGRRTRTDSMREMPLAPADLLRQQREGHGTLIYGNARGAELRLRPWFNDRDSRTQGPGSFLTAPGRSTRSPTMPSRFHVLRRRPSAHRVKAGEAMTTVKEWINQDPLRRAPEFDFGTQWTREHDPNTEWAVTYNTGTGELYARTRTGDDVEVLGQFADPQDVADAVPEWGRRSMQSGSLDWIRREALALNTAAPEPDHGRKSDLRRSCSTRTDTRSRSIEPQTIGDVAQRLGTDPDLTSTSLASTPETAPTELSCASTTTATDKHLPVNATATELYGTGWPILGDAVVVTDDQRPLPPDLARRLLPEIDDPSPDLATAPVVEDRVLDWDEHLDDRERNHDSDLTSTTAGRRLQRISTRHVPYRYENYGDLEATGELNALDAYIETYDVDVSEQLVVADEVGHRVANGSRRS